MEYPKFVTVEMKDGRTVHINLKFVVVVEERPEARPPVWRVTLEAHRLAKVWRIFRSPMASESIVLALDAEEVKPLLQAIDSDRIDLDPEF
jgi:hypothetical protein